MRFVFIFLGVALALVLLPAGGVAQEADATQPVVTCDAGDSVWHGADVSIACIASDGESGLANPADASFTLTTSVFAGEESADAMTDSRQVCDNASNCATAGPVNGNKVDKKSPVAICGVPDALWHASDVAIACTTTDGGSGLADPTQASVLLSTGVAGGTETSDADTDSVSVCDLVANCSPAGPVRGNKVDKKAPLDPPTLRSTDHRIGKWSRDRWIDMYWTGSSDGGSQVDGFSFSWSKLSTSAPDQLKDREQGAHRATSSRLTNGKWFFHIRTLDNVGNWSVGVDRGPYFIDVTRPQVRALSASGKVGRTMRLKYRTADNTHRTRERITVARNGSLVASWSRRMGTAAWDTVQYVSWTPRATGAYTFCVRAWDRARNSRRNCAALSVSSPAPAPSNCDSAYPTICLHDGIGDYDCAGGSGDGPNYVYATNFTVRSPDPFGLDGDGDGIGCET